MEYLTVDTGVVHAFSDLKVDDFGNITSEIEDLEGDVYEISFPNDGGVHIDTRGDTYIKLGQDTLYWLMKAIEVAEAYYDDAEAYYDDNA